MSYSATALAAISERRSFEIWVRIMEGDRYASLDLDLKAIAAVMFSGAVVEEVIRYGDFLFGRTPPGEQAGSIERLAHRFDPQLKDWVDFYEHGEEFAAAFEEIIRGRIRGTPI